MSTKWKVLLLLIDNNVGCFDDFAHDEYNFAHQIFRVNFSSATSEKE